MDYLRIYNELIEHRKMLPRLEGTYYERHHIVPKCLGGGNKKENLIYLTAEEHFVAHLLLAHIYGGGLWLAAQAMTMDNGNGRRISNRRTFAVARARAANAAWDPVVYEFRNLKTGLVFSATRREIFEKYGLSICDIHDLVSERVVYCKGLSLSKNNPVRKQYDSTVHKFRNVATGEIVESTRSDFIKKLGARTDGVDKVISGELKTVHGWCLDSTKDFTRKNPHIKEFKNFVTGEMFKCTTPELATMFDLNIDSLSKLASGQNTTHKMFCMSSTSLDNIDVFNSKCRTFTLQNIEDKSIVTGNRTELTAWLGFKDGQVQRLVQGRIKKACGYTLLCVGSPDQ